MHPLLVTTERVSQLVPDLVPGMPLGQVPAFLIHSLNRCSARGMALVYHRLQLSTEISAMRPRLATIGVGSRIWTATRPYAGPRVP